jgi:hypothetical protein
VLLQQPQHLLLLITSWLLAAEVAEQLVAVAVVLVVI